VRLTPAAKESEPTEVPIELVATARPVLSPVTNRDKLSGIVTKCGPLQCGPTGFLVPGDAGDRKRAIEFTLGRSQTAKVTAVRVFADGETDAHQVTAAQLGLPKTVEASTGVVSIPTTIDADALPPDHYTGAVHLEVEDVDAPVVVPVDFSVRDEPLFALLALAVGVLAGLLSKLYRGGGTKLLALYRRANLLERRMGADADLLQKLAAARAAIAANDTAEAERILNEIEAKLKVAGITIDVPAQPSGGTTKKPKIWRREGFLKWVSYGAGIVVGVVIVFTGFQTQYVDKGTTFGTGDLWDYVALAAWGFAAGVAGKAVGTSATGATGTAG
jgi:hypothetical protein